MRGQSSVYADGERDRFRRRNLFRSDDSFGDKARGANTKSVNEQTPQIAGPVDGWADSPTGRRLTSARLPSRRVVLA
jgi:hypothetical protein